MTTIGHIKDKNGKQYELQVWASKSKDRTHYNMALYDGKVQVGEFEFDSYEGELNAYVDVVELEPAYRGLGIYSPVLMLARDYFKGIGLAAVVSLGKSRNGEAEKAWSKLTDKRVVVQTTDNIKYNDYILEQTTNTTELQAGDQLFVNNKWYFDVKNVDGENVKVRIKYAEGANVDQYSYKVIKLPLELFRNCTRQNFVVKCQMVEKDLKRQIGGLIDRLAREADITSIVEEMGAVCSPGISGKPGVPGTAGSGDVSGSVLPTGSIGMEIIPKVNRKYLKKIASKGKNNRNGIRTPLLSLFKENNEPNGATTVSDTDTDTVNNVSQLDVMTSDNDYKQKVYQFLDYPADNEYDIQMIDAINDWRASFLDASSQRIKQYFKDLYKTNRALIKNKCSEWFQNNILIVGEITETGEQS